MIPKLHNSRAFSSFCLFICFILGNPDVVFSQHSAIETQLSSFQRSIERLTVKSSENWQNSISDQIFQERNLSSDCLTVLKGAISSGYTQEWSAKFLAFNHFTGDDLLGNLLRSQYTSLGDFDECLSIEHSPESQLPLSFQGKYCLVQLTTPSLPYGPFITGTDLPSSSEVNSTFFTRNLAAQWLHIRNRFPLTRGICVPSVCSSTELESLIAHYYHNDLKGLNLTVDYCQERRQFNWLSSPSPGYRIALGIFSLFTFASLAGTLVGSLLPRKDTKSSPYLSFARCFHLGENIQTIFQMVSPNTVQPNGLDYQFLHFIKVLLSICVIFVHAFIAVPATYQSALSLLSNYPSFIGSLQSSLAYNAILQGPLILDAFFIISAFLASTWYLQKPLPSFARFALLRWARFLPSLAGLYSLSFLAQKLASGPLAHRQLTDPFVKPCADHWLAHALMLHNFLPINQMCGPHLWYLPVEFQLYLFLYLLLRLHFYRKSLSYVVSATIGLLVASAYVLLIIYRIIAIAYVDYPARFNLPIPYTMIRIVYTSPLSHLFPYLCGMAIAMRLATFSGGPTKCASFSSYPDLKLTCILFLLVGCVFVPLPGATEKSASTDPFAGSSTVYDLSCLLVKGVNSLAYSLFIYQCILCDRATSWLKRAFSASFFHPLSRLSFGMYLVHPLLIWFNLSQNTQTPHLSFFTQLQFAFSIYLQSFLLSLLLYVLFEGPIKKLMNTFLKGDAHLRKDPHQATVQLKKDN